MQKTSIRNVAAADKRVKKTQGEEKKAREIRSPSESMLSGRQVQRFGLNLFEDLTALLLTPFPNQLVSTLPSPLQISNTAIRQEPKAPQSDDSHCKEPQGGRENPRDVLLIRVRRSRILNSPNNKIGVGKRQKSRVITSERTTVGEQKVRDGDEEKDLERVQQMDGTCRRKAHRRGKFLTSSTDGFRAEFADVKILYGKTWQEKKTGKKNNSNLKSSTK
ncbi:hypothetical protein RUM43_007503 [Polyplax serrata]|uniref:Uncharacterized protein n=1 Tax=Polyplax serrata TaxID=468196 RepID=A0AAN8PMC7_POLSC